MDDRKSGSRQPIAKGGLYEGFKRAQRSMQHERRLREFVESVDEEIVLGGMGPSPDQELSAAIREYALPKIEEARRRPVQVQSDSPILMLPPNATSPPAFSSVSSIPLSKSGADTSPKPRLKYRSAVKRVILRELTINPDATAHDICRAIDSDGGVELPESWKPAPDCREFNRAFMDKDRRPRIEKMISKVRRDMRSAHLLPLR